MINRILHRWRRYNRQPRPSSPPNNTTNNNNYPARLCCITPTTTDEPHTQSLLRAQLEPPPVPPRRRRIDTTAKETTTPPKPLPRAPRPLPRKPTKRPTDKNASLTHGYPAENVVKIHLKAPPNTSTMTELGIYLADELQSMHGFKRAQFMTSRHRLSVRSVRETSLARKQRHLKSGQYLLAVNGTSMMYRGVAGADAVLRAELARAPAVTLTMVSMDHFGGRKRRDERSGEPVRYEETEDCGGESSAGVLSSEGYAELKEPGFVVPCRALDEDGIS